MHLIWRLKRIIHKYPLHPYKNLFFGNISSPVKYKCKSCGYESENLVMITKSYMGGAVKMVEFKCEHCGKGIGE